MFLCRKHDHPAHCALPDHWCAERDGSEDVRSLRLCAGVCGSAGHQNHPELARGEESDAVERSGPEQFGLSAGVLTAR